ncbi:E3 ubiquitin/ISG15 ligase TRIM25-like [Polymixia lowei]
MAQQQQQQGIGLDWDQFTCSICLDLLKEPVSINCGHNYCRTCIKDCWDQEEEKGVYSCPQCRESFSPRPALRRNNMLAEVVEKLKKTEVQQASSSAPLSYAGPEDVACDFCTGTRRHKAVMSCLTCLVSCCDTHLQPHYSVPVLKRHKLVPATDCLQEKMCSRHNKLMEVYCRTDQQCICYCCDKKSTTWGSAQTAVEDSERIFTELISSIERRSREVKELIRDQEKTAVCRAEGLLLQLEEEIAKLRRNQTDLEKLSHTDDHIHFIQDCIPGMRQHVGPLIPVYSPGGTFPDLNGLPDPTEAVEIRKRAPRTINRDEGAYMLGSPDLPSIVVGPLRYFRDVSDAVSDLRDKLEKILKDTWPRISSTEPQTREDFLQYCCPLSLDHNSVYKHLTLSEENRKVRFINQDQMYPDHSDRFTGCNQVLCREGLSGRCYWELEWKGGYIYAAVAYKDIERTSDRSWFGDNDKSWSLYCSQRGYTFIHNKVEQEVSGPLSSRVGVYLDHEAGVLSFYSVSDTMTLLHKVSTTFTQPLYPGLCVDSEAELMKLW